MGNYFLLRDGLISDSSKYGFSIPVMEKTDNTDAYTLTTSDSWSTALSGMSGDIIDSIAVHLSGRAATPVGVLSASIKQYAGTVTKNNITYSIDSPFGVGTDSSISFVRTSESYVQILAGADTTLGAGNFTIEFWFKTSGFTSDSTLYGCGAAAANNLRIVGRAGPNRIVVLVNAAVILTSPTIDSNWHHVCVTRNGNTVTLYIDGVSSGTAINTTNFSAGATVNTRIGAGAAAGSAYTGLISNFRILVGAAIVPPLPAAWTPLQVVPNTRFLYKSLYQDLYENSSANLVSSIGTWPVSSFTPYDGSNNTVAVYPLNWQLLRLPTPLSNNSTYFKLNLKTSNDNQLTLMGADTDNGVNYDCMPVIDNFLSYQPRPMTRVTNEIFSDTPLTDGSETTCVYLSGGTSSIVTSNSPDANFGGAPFTIEGWFKPDIAGSPQTQLTLICYLDNGANGVQLNGWNLDIVKSTSLLRFRIYDMDTGNVAAIGTTAISTNTWHHIAVTSEGSSSTTNRLRIFVDGNLYATSTAAITIKNSQGQIGLGMAINNAGRSYMKGYISNVRVIENVCLYTNSFPVDSSQFTGYVSQNAATRFLYREPYTSYFLYNTTADNLHISGKISQYSTENITVTANTGTLKDVYVHKNGLLKFPNTSTTLTFLGTNGLQATSEGTIQVGSSTSPVPSDTTHAIILSGNHIGVSTGGRLDVYGAYKVPYGKLDLDITAGNTFFWGQNTQSITNFSSWQVGDRAVILPNTEASNTTEIITIQSSSFLGCDFIPAAAFSHPRISYLPSVANLTRNVKIGGASYTAKGNIQARGGAFVNVNNAEFKYIDSSLTTGVDNNGLFLLSGCTLSGTGTETLLSPIATEFATIFNGSSFLKGAANNTDFSVNAGTDYTFEVFIKPSINLPSLSLAGIFGVNIADNSAAFRLILFSKYIEFRQYYTASKYKSIRTASNTVLAGKWYHVAVVGRGSRVYLYLNGILQSSMAQVTFAFSSTFVPNIGTYNSTTRVYNGKISNLRFVKGRAMYTGNFTPPSQNLTTVTDTNVFTAILAFQDSAYTRDKSYRDDTFIVTGAITTELDSPFGKNASNVIIGNNVLFKTQYGIFLDNINSQGSLITNNLLLSSKEAGIYINSGLKGTINLSNNMSVGPSPFGSYIEDENTEATLGGIVNYNNTYGMYFNNSRTRKIDNIINTYNTKDGVYVDATTTQLNDTTFSNITASNNKTLGFRVTGNPIDHLSPITLNIHRLVANDNLSGGFEGYCISGYLSSVELNRNGFYGMKTSIGNYNTTIDGITSLMSNTAGVSASVGILSGTCYYPILIDRANLGKADPASTFGAGISLDSTKFSQFVVNNSTIKGGTFDFELKTTRDIIEGSYLIKKTTVSNTPVGLGITPANYQSDTNNTTGFAFTNMNNTSGYHITYLAAGQRFSDTGIFATSSDAPSERLTPSSTSIKLKSGSKFVALNAGDYASIKVYVRKSNANNGGIGNVYNGSAPRLILRAAPHMGIPADVVMSQLNTDSDTFQLLGATTTAVTESGVLEFYVDCDGTQGWINIDNWSAT